jgi:hypothetical protein
MVFGWCTTTTCMVLMSMLLACRIALRARNGRSLCAFVEMVLPLRSSSVLMPEPGRVVVGTGRSAIAVFLYQKLIQYFLSLSDSCE